TDCHGRGPGAQTERSRGAHDCLRVVARPRPTDGTLRNTNYSWYVLRTMSRWRSHKEVIAPEACRGPRRGACRCARDRVVRDRGPAQPHRCRAWPVAHALPRARHPAGPATANERAGRLTRPRETDDVRADCPGRGTRARRAGTEPR